MLSPTGLLLSVSFAQPHFRLPLLQHAPSAFTCLEPKPYGAEGALETYVYVLSKGLSGSGRSGALSYAPCRFETEPAHEHMDDEDSFLGAMTLTAEL